MIIYQTETSWSRPRRVVGKAEHLPDGANPRFVVTSLGREKIDAREESVGRLFLAAIVPGLILAAAMSLAIVLMAIFWPSFVGGDETPDDDGENIASAALKLLPIVILIIVVLIASGGIYGGVFTPTEAGAAGAMGALSS